MKNPLRKRILRDLRSGFGKYLVIFFMLMLTISFISGFFIASSSMIAIYNESFEKYNIEDGHFITQNRINKSKRQKIEEYGVSVYGLNYVEEKSGENKLRIYKDRSDIDRVCLMEGSLPASSDEIAIDRMYAVNNEIKTGDKIDVAGKYYRVSGLIALSDYSSLFENNGDTMFDAVKFGVAVVTEECFDMFDKDEIIYCYAWKYDKEPQNTAKEKELADDFIENLGEEVYIESCIPRYQNQAIIFSGDDLGGDRAMMVALLYIVIVIMSFVFIIIINDTIMRESNVIGTLRAMGYTKSELVRHYMTLPFLVSLAAALVGNILGYLVFADVMKDMYYASYSMTTYHNVLNYSAFIITTVIPVIILNVINFASLNVKLSLSPLRFIRRDITVVRRKKTVKLGYFISFFTRFRLRIIMQNIGSYVILFIGIFFGNVLLVFGVGMPDCLDAYQQNMIQNMICDYQYILSVPSNSSSDELLRSVFDYIEYEIGISTENENAEKFSVYSLEHIRENGSSEDILIYGIEDDSKYVELDTGNGQIYVSSAYHDKYGVDVGDTIMLKEPYTSKTYELKIDGIYDYMGGLDIFMNISDLNEMLDWDKNFFCGYFSNEKLTDIDKKYISSITDYDAVTKVSRQLDKSMGSNMLMIDGFSIVMFVVLIYILSKLIIEKNAQSISMIKILGYSNSEISRLYINATTIVTVILLLVTIPMADVLMRFLFKVIMREMTGWIPWDVEPGSYVKVFAMGLVSYAVVALLEMRRIRKVPMDQALKNVE